MVGLVTACGEVITIKGQRKRSTHIVSAIRKCSKSIVLSFNFLFGPEVGMCCVRMTSAACDLLMTAVD